jgi:hypothetical protein
MCLQQNREGQLINRSQALIITSLAFAGAAVVAIIGQKLAVSSILVAETILGGPGFWAILLVLTFTGFAANRLSRRGHGLLSLLMALLALGLSYGMVTFVYWGGHVWVLFIAASVASFIGSAYYRYMSDETLKAFWPALLTVSGLLLLYFFVSTGDNLERFTTISYISYSGNNAYFRWNEYWLHVISFTFIVFTIWAVIRSSATRNSRVITPTLAAATTISLCLSVTWIELLGNIAFASAR